MAAWLVCTASWCNAQSTKKSGAKNAVPPETAKLKQDFIAMLRGGDAQKFLSYVSAEGVNVGSEPRHETHDEVQQQIDQRNGLYCKLFDASCIEATIKLDNGVRPCSYREALNGSKNPHIAVTETVRGGVRQAILVAQPNAKQCPGTKLIDFIFNYEPGGWKLFSVP
jgi:hypothetical protein